MVPAGRVSRGLRLLGTEAEKEEGPAEDGDASGDQGGRHDLQEDLDAADPEDFAEQDSHEIA